MARLPGPRLWEQGLWALRLRRRPAETFAAMYEAVGPVFAFGAGPMRFVFLVGPDAHRPLFADIERYTWREVTKPVMVVDGETALVVSDGDDHARRRRIVQPAFNSRRIDRHVPLMVEEAQRTLRAWTAGRELNAYEEMTRRIRAIVIHYM